MKENQHIELKESWHDEYPRYRSALYLTFSHERVNELTDTERAVYRLVANKPSVTQLELAAELRLTVQYIRKIMKALKDKNYIERVGADKNGYWKIIEKS